MARTRRADYQRSNRIRTLPLSDPEQAALAAHRLLKTRDATGRRGRPLGRIRVLNRTPARGDVVRASAFLNTLLHEFCHHHDAERLGILHSFHTSGFYARIRHLRDQIEAGAGDGLEDGAAAPAAFEPGPLPLLERLWSIIRGL